MLAGTKKKKHSKYTKEDPDAGRVCNNYKASFHLNEQRLETAWFLFSLIQFFRDINILNTIDFSPDRTSFRRNIEEACMIAMDHLFTQESEWINHICKKPGCAEGFICIDGNQKLKRRICAAPKNKINLMKDMPNVVQCCINSPIFGGQHKQNSKFCLQHMYLDKCNDRIRQNNYQCTSITTSPSPFKIARNIPQTLTIPPIVITLKEYTYSIKKPLVRNSFNDLPDNDHFLQNGCKNEDKVPKFHDTTAGVFALVKPCGIIIAFSEMYTCESSNQVFSLLLRLLADNTTIHCIGYDRSCQFHAFLKNLKDKGNPGAKLLLKKSRIFG